MNGAVYPLSHLIIRHLRGKMEGRVKLDGHFNRPGPAGPAGEGLVAVMQGNGVDRHLR